MAVFISMIPSITDCGINNSYHENLWNKPAIQYVIQNYNFKPGARRSQFFEITFNAQVYARVCVYAPEAINN